MDLLIKNMDMPKNGNLTLVVHPNGEVYLGDVLEDIKIGKAIELPPHGDLIGRDDVLNELKKYYKVGELAEVGEIVCFIEEADVILEANT